jgi:epidermal growth factor receptor kinase substrate 8
MNFPRADYLTCLTNPMQTHRGEILEVLDDSRKWWKARNSRGQVAHVPHTIVSEAVVSGGNSHPSSPSEDWIRKERQGKKGEFRYF